MKKAIIISLLSVVMLSGCGFLNKFRGGVNPPAGGPTKVVVDPKLLQPCQLLPELPEAITFENIAAHHISTIGLYGECKLKQEDSIKTIRKLGNIE